MAALTVMVRNFSKTTHASTSTPVAGMPANRVVRTPPSASVIPISEAPVKSSAITLIFVVCALCRGG